MAIRAMVFDGPGRPLRAVECAEPAPGPGELLVRVRACTLCGSDLHTYEGRRDTPLPTVLGHEVLGELPAGAALTDFRGRPLRLGDRVVWSVAASCGGCFPCTHDLPQKCERLFKYGHERLDPGRGPDGGLATHCRIVPGTALFRVPDELPYLVACPAGCATATVAAALRHAGDLRGGAVLVLGAGMLGLTAAAWAHSAGARVVLVADVDAGRLATAERFGATHLLRADAGGEAMSREVRALTDGRGADVAIEVSGSPEAVEASLSLLRVGGRAVWVGAVLPTRPVSVIPEAVVRRHLSLHGVHNYRPDDLGAALDFLEEQHHVYPFAELVAATFPLDEAEAAFRFAAERRPVRVAVAP